MAKLNQIIAIEKGIKSETYSQLTAMDKANQKPELFSGLVRTYKPQNQDDPEKLPGETKRVQLRATEVLNRLAHLNTEYFEITARKDWSNCVAKADVKVGDKTLLTDVPVTYLLFLEKQLTDMRTMIGRIPVHDSAEKWMYDENAGVYKNEMTTTHRTKKVPTPIVLYNATEHHPAQTSLEQIDVIAGFWETTKQSGALPYDRKEALMTRIDTLIQAVKQAREEANGIDEVKSPKVGDAIFSYLLAPSEAAAS